MCSGAADAKAPGRRSGVSLWMFSLYKVVLSPVLQSFGLGQCVFLPTCSEYAYVAVQRHGWWRGGWMALRRVARCHPFAQGGFDPVP